MTKSEHIACIFPETRPDERLVFPLVQVFDQVVYMQAVENDSSPGDRTSPLIERLLAENRLRLMAPAPLGEDRQRFLALIRDMTMHKETYLGQLSMLTLAEMHQGRGGESSSAILSGLLPGREQRQDKTALLWQSRLVLKLGELHDQEQAELAEAMRRISKDQEDLLAALREDDDQPFALTAELGEPAQETTAMLDHRLRAWTRLVLAESGQPLPSLGLTGHGTVVDALKEVYERQRGTAPLPLGRLPLPPLPPSLNPDDASFAPLHRRCPELHAALAALATGAGNDAQAREQLARAMTAWSALPAVAEGCSGVLDLFFFAGISLGQLMAAAWGDTRTDMVSHHAPAEGCTVGLLTMTDPRMVS